MYVLYRICCPEQVECRTKLNDVNEGVCLGGLPGVETGNWKLLALGWKHPWYIQGSTRRSLCLEMSDPRSNVRRGQRCNGCVAGALRLSTLWETGRWSTQQKFIFSSQVCAP